MSEWPRHPAAPAAPAPRVQAFGISGVGEIRAGDDLAGALLAGLASSGEHLQDGDIVVLASKAAAKAEGRQRTADDRQAAIQAETVRVIAERATPRGLTQIVQARSGPVLAAAGVDASNLPPGTVLPLPADPDASARALRADLAGRTGRRVAVVLSDTLGRPWRDGQIDQAIGAAGLRVADDLRGRADAFGTPLEATVRALADQVAALADLVKGKVDGVPGAVVRGLAALVTVEDGPGAAALLRPAEADWFRFGHAEAVRAALGVPPGTPAALAALPPAGGIEPVQRRVARAVAVALADLPGGSAAGRITPEAPAESNPSGQLVRVRAPDPFRLGVLVQRLQVAAWSEDLSATQLDPAPIAEPSGCRLRVQLAAADWRG